jgi:hypothetical protein
MSVLTDLIGPNLFPNQFTGVVRMVNHWLAMHVQGSIKACISNHPEKDIEVARLAAKTFANLHHILYEEHPLEFDRPVLTIMKDRSSGNWYPTELHPDKVSILTHCKFLDIGGTQNEAIQLTKAIALGTHRDFIPSIGISLDTTEPLAN